MAVPWKWKPNKLRDGGKFAGKTDRVVGTQRGLEIGPGAHRLSATPEEVKAWREKMKPEFGGISATGGAKSAPIPRKPEAEAMSLYVNGEDGGAVIRKSALDNPASVNPDNARLDAADERRATSNAITRGTQGRLL